MEKLLDYEITNMLRNYEKIHPLSISPLPRNVGGQARGRKWGLGFTIIEAVVAVSIFSMAMTSIIGMYLSVQKLNQASASLNALQQNARFISEDISKIIRNGEIDYSRYPLGSAPQPAATDLYLIDRSGTQIRIYLQNETLILDKLGIGSANFTSKEVKVKDFKVYIWPATNPYPGGNDQPTAAIYLDLESNVNPRDKTRAKFQVTLTTRQYPE